MPPQGADENTNLSTPYQSLGSRGVNNLTSKLRLALFPPGNPFFRFQIDDETLAALGATDSEAAEQIEGVMQKLENDALDELEQGSDSVILHAAIKQLVTVGNVLLHMPKSDASRVFRLQNYVVVRDASGNWFEIVAQEVVSKYTLPEDVKMSVNDTKDDDEDVTIYTHINAASRHTTTARSSRFGGLHWRTRTTDVDTSRNTSVTCARWKTCRKTSCHSPQLPLR
jgi:hypothetical protein